MKDRKGTVRQHPNGQYAIATAEFDPARPSAARWVMSDMANGSWFASDLFVSDWPVHFTPEPPLGSILVRNDEIAYKVRIGYWVIETSGEENLVTTLDNAGSWTILREGLE